MQHGRSDNVTIFYLCFEFTPLLPCCWDQTWVENHLVAHDDLSNFY